MTTPTPEAIEAAARAICATQFPDVPGTYAWNVQWEDGKEEYRAEATAALSAAYPLMEAHAKAEAFREAADEDERLRALGSIPSGQVTDKDRADYWAHQEITTADWLRARAATIDEQPCCAADGETCSTCASYAVEDVTP